jgi:hypothetical protein
LKRVKTKLSDESTDMSTLGLRGIKACGGDRRLGCAMQQAISSETGKPAREGGKSLPFMRGRMSQLETKQEYNSIM